MLGRSFGGRGYATEAVLEMMRFLRESLGVTIIRATVDARNEPSIRLAERLGFVATSRSVGTVIEDGEPFDELNYERSEGDV